MAPTAEEKVVSIRDPIPRGYMFVPKGNSYITMNCRKQTKEQNSPMYVVLDNKKQQVGIRVPIAVYQKVQQQEKATHASRAQATKRRDDKTVSKLKSAILGLFPQLPAEELPLVVKHATTKHSGRVGRTATKSIAEKASLAVRAHVRHLHTEYDKLLRSGTSRDDARKQVQKDIDAVLLKWGWKPEEEHRTRPHGGSKQMNPHKSTSSRKHTKPSTRPSLSDKKLAKRGANAALAAETQRKALTAKAVKAPKA
ncbi:uncharacterized protein F4822DRAFT_426446 [Hypoxylon trugodes]|uniref:uncharacterized protein n=1 Tax=Hypoxylon trugodes TaxID=326681 RepID=UPI00219E2977|nr:uncharacterized protein F4822DRAFT_426446 [Hypoxylon trugodes]KAI1390598.1 hypothetical protein F4822DRAFT_426446 [Hypoxylon trugodes]